MQEDENPFTPPRVRPVIGEARPTSPGPKSHWFIRVTISLIGLMMVGMAVAAIAQTPGLLLNLLVLAVLSLGAILFRAGIVDQPPKLSLLNSSRSKRRRPF